MIPVRFDGEHLDVRINGGWRTVPFPALALLIGILVLSVAWAMFYGPPAVALVAWIMVVLPLVALLMVLAGLLAASLLSASPNSGDGRSRR
jgi:hypothetical protein